MTTLPPSGEIPSNRDAEPVSDAQVEALVVDAAPAVAYQDRPWVMAAGIIGALALGGLVFGTLVSGQRAREIGGVVPTRNASTDTGDRKSVV